MKHFSIAKDRNDDDEDSGAFPEDPSSRAGT
jgi:hypothetical protein